MPAIERSEIVKQLVTTCEFPKVINLEDHTCYICQEVFQGPNGSKIPIKLLYGHVVGMTYLTTYTFLQIEVLENPSPRYPFCREILLNREGPVTSTRTRDETDLYKIWFPAIASWTPGSKDKYSQTDTADAWIRRAEYLWDNLCNAILDRLDNIDLSIGLYELIESFFYGSTYITERFLCFGTILNFYNVYINQNWRPETPGIPREFPERYNLLIAHLNTASRVDLDEDTWRCQSAYYGP